MIGFFSGAVLGGAITFNFFLNGKNEILTVLLLFSSAIVGSLVPRYIFRNYITAKCKIPGCNGDAYCKGSKPIRYECSKCGNIYHSKIREGKW
jgi:hypothetical protein